MHAVSALLPAMRRSSRVRWDPLVSHGDAHAAQRGMRQNIAIERVKHHRRVDAFEHAGLQQLDLSASAFFGGRADDLHRPWQGVRMTGEREERAHGTARDQIVPARVTDLGQRVVLGQDGDLR